MTDPGPFVMHGMPIDVALTFAVWIELLIYGIYVCLFISALSVMCRRRSSNRATWSAWIFLISVLSMFMVATLHIITMLYRFLRGYILHVDPKGGFSYFYDFTRWDNVLNNALLCTMSWLGDALVIYRCYYVWNCNFWIILLPLLLFFATVGINAYTLYWFTHPFDTHLNVNVMVPLLNTIYPLALIQNVLTTGLISFKIWFQHRASSASGVVDRGTRLSLIRILRIVVESAMIYTLQLLVLIILYFRQNNAQYIIQSAVVPSIGIVFVLIAVRVHIAKSKSGFGTGLGTIPAWLDEGDSAIEMSGQRSSSPGVGVTFRVAANDLNRNDDSEPFDSSSYTHKNHTGDKLLHVV